MAVVSGYVGRIGVVSGSEPLGRITLVDPDNREVVVAEVRCATGPKLDVAILARTLGQLCEIDVLTSTTPMVADKVRLL